MISLYITVFIICDGQLESAAPQHNEGDLYAKIRVTQAQQPIKTKKPVMWSSPSSPPNVFASNSKLANISGSSGMQPIQCKHWEISQLLWQQAGDQIRLH